MREIELSDQLSAMAIIDELYQKQQLLLEHLDRDQLRNNLQEKIKNYYQSKGQFVDDKTIEQGINLWFDRRLRFDEPKRSWVQYLLINCYIKRNLVFTVIGISLILFTLIIFSDLNRAKRLNNNIKSTYNHILASKRSLGDLNNKFKEINSYQVNFTQVSANKLKAEISSLLKQDIIPSLPNPEKKNSFATSSKKEVLQKLQRLDSSIDHKLTAIASKIAELSRLLEDDKKLAQLIHSEGFINASKQYPVLQVTVDELLDSLNQGQKDIDFNHIEELYSSVERAKTLENKIEADIRRLKTLNVPESDMGSIFALQKGLQADLKSLNFANVENYHQMMAYYIKLAQTPLTLMIVDNPNYKSGVERTHNNTNGKSWYLIVTPTSANGKPTSLWVTSIETGETKKVQMFGQQVTQSAYNEVKADKMQDGHIDNNQLCNKPISRLTFDCPISVKSGRILEW